MRVVTIGRRGQLVRCLMERAHGTDAEIVAIGRPEFDLVEPETILPALSAAAPDIVVNAAAVTAVDLAEADATASALVNKAGAERVAVVAAAMGVPVIHISTDYVFDGTAGRPYAEDDAPNPLNVYGVSKLAGERAVAAANPRHLIVRTAWVHSPFGANFVRWVLDAARTGNEIKVVADQWGSPTSGLELADAILHAAAAVQAGSAEFGLYHVAGSGSVNRSGQARAVIELSRRLGGPHAEVRDIGTTAAGQRAARPRNSSLSSEKFARTFGWPLMPWQEGLEPVVARLIALDHRVDA